MIIFRYLTKEVLGSLLSLTFVLLLIFLSNELVRYLGYAASGKIASNILFRLMGYEIPYLLSLLLPLGLFLGVVLTYSRLYAENEMRVLHACGLSVQQLTEKTAIIAFFVSLFILCLTLWINPLIAKQKEVLFTQSAAANLLDTLMPGRFQVANHGQRVVYVEKITRDHKRADNLFIADQQKKEADPKSSRWMVLAAAHGFQQTNPMTHERFVVATDGYRYEGVPGQTNYHIIQFQKYATQLPDLMTDTKRQQQAVMSSKKLFQAYHNPDDAAELQWRISIPLSAFLLAIIAIPFSQVKPRQGRYSTLLQAILLYVIYMNLLFVARNFIEQKVIPISVGVWWVHAIAIIIPSLYLYRQAHVCERRTS